jgi:hypothetical protein
MVGGQRKKSQGGNEFVLHEHLPDFATGSPLTIVTYQHRWALSSISVISNIGLKERTPTLYRILEESFIRYPISVIPFYSN